MRRRLARRLVAETAGFELGENLCRCSDQLRWVWLCVRLVWRPEEPSLGGVWRIQGLELTSDPIDGPLLELFERDFCRGRDGVEVQSVRILDRFVGWSGELFALVVEGGPSFGVDSVHVLSDHFSRVCRRRRKMAFFGLRMARALTT